MSKKVETNEGWLNPSNNNTSTSKKDVEEKTLQETINEFFKIMLWYIPDKDFSDDIKFRELYISIKEKATIEVDCHKFTADIKVITRNKTYTTKTNILSGKFLEIRNTINQGFDGDAYEWCGIWQIETLFFNAFLDEFRLKCITCSSKELEEELTDDTLIKSFQQILPTAFEYVFLNPQQDVIEWGLKHKKALGIKDTTCEFIRKYQTNPELKDLIFKNL